VEPTPTILVVDDVPMFRELGSLFLARCGRVITASSAREALALAARERPAVIVLDAHLPDLPGEEVCLLLKRAAPAGGPGASEVPVVVVTGTGSAEEHEAAIRAGADDVLSKPLSRAVLVEAVQRFTRFPVPRGLPRVSVVTPVRILRGDAEAWGTARNLSRGGMFVECDEALAPDQEIAVQFRLPGSPDDFRPTARVVWRREAQGGRSGVGLRFLSLGAPAARELDDYVREWAPPEAFTFAWRRPFAGGAQ
jgi:uncharacterized protein (TIGR02266 family)